MKAIALSIKLMCGINITMPKSLVIMQEYTCELFARGYIRFSCITYTNDSSIENCSIALARLIDSRINDKLITVSRSRMEISVIFFIYRVVI